MVTQYRGKTKIKQEIYLVGRDGDSEKIAHWDLGLRDGIVDSTVSIRTRQLFNKDLSPHVKKQLLSKGYL